MISFEESKKIIQELVKEFKSHEDYYKSKDYDEENTKINFINKFFIALGWDVNNDKGTAPQYKDVIFEASMKVSGKHKAPDYCFRYGGTPLFYVEAKKPSENILLSKDHAFQLKSYVWSANLPIGILTDFEELSVYERNTKPNINHKTNIDRIAYYHYSQYVDKWEEIWNIFSKEAVRTGGFDKYAKDTTGAKKGTGTVDQEFLKTIEDWRLKLSRNIALRNKELTVEELNYSVQTIIDRIIFLRIAEDRGIEKYEKLQEITTKPNVYQEFNTLCKNADKKYNSGLFHFKEDENISLAVDTITPSLIIDDDILKKIIKELYYPNNPYEFSVIPTEILGNIYEQFLGKIIRLTNGHQAKVEDKPEIKKQGGVYYTPQYIVDYIVNNTIGELIKDKTPEQISKLKIVDPACGSGSFLIRAYQKLLDYHLEYYTNMEEPPENTIYTDKQETPQLTLQEKKRILLNNIYGVDLDSQAVEVTKLSLLLKVLENETKEKIEQGLLYYNEKALPYLGDNIRCGNSLIGTDITEQQELTIEEIKELNPFNWETEFKEIFDNGGFDIVIGNPPYVKEFTNRKVFDNLKSSPYYQGKMDLWYFFGCKALDIIKENGLVSFIATNNWITSFGASKFRNKVNTEGKFRKFLDFGNYKVFKTASIQTMIYIMKKDSKNDKYTFDYQILLDDKINEKELKDFLHSNNTCNKFNKFETVYDRKENKDSYFNFVDKNISKILNKIQKNDNITYLKNSEISQGIVSPQEDLNKRNTIKLNNQYPQGTGIFVINDNELKNLKLNENEYELIKPYYTTSKLKRYYSNPNNDRWIIYTRSDINGKIKKYPNIKKHLDKFKKVITSSNKPYGLSRARKEEIFTNEKIIVTRKCLIPTFSYCNFNAYVSQTFMVINSNRLNLKYLTGILNSKLVQFYLKYKGKMQGNNYQLDKEPLLKIPIAINNELESDIVKVVERILKLQEELAISKTPHDIQVIERQIPEIEDKINQLVYDLYDLTPEEISIVEEAIK